MGISLVFFPLFYSIVFLVIFFISGNLLFTFIYIVLAFISGFLALNWLYNWREVTQKIKVNRLFKSVEYQGLIAKREDLKKCISLFYTFPNNA